MAAERPAGNEIVSVCPHCGTADPTDGGKYCGAHTRQAGSHPHCRLVAGFKTNHVGAGRCNLHGGSSLVWSGRYSRIKRPRLRELIAEFEDDPDPLNIIPDLNAGRALFVDFIERYDGWLEALLEWHASWQLSKRPLPSDLTQAFTNVVDEWEQQLAVADEEPTTKQKDDVTAARQFIDYVKGIDPSVRPRQVLDISAAVSHLDTITKMVERVEKIRAANAISRVDFFRLMNQMGTAVQKYVTDAETLRKIALEWGSLGV